MSRPHAEERDDGDEDGDQPVDHDREPARRRHRQMERRRVHVLQQKMVDDLMVVDFLTWKL